MLPKDKNSAIKQMKMEDALKNVDLQKNANKAKKLGMVPVDDDDDDDDDILDGL